MLPVSAGSLLGLLFKIEDGGDVFSRIDVALFQLHGFTSQKSLLFGSPQ
jgi:hypothetical protein